MLDECGESWFTAGVKWSITGVECVDACYLAWQRPRKDTPNLTCVRSTDASETWKLRVSVCVFLIERNLLHGSSGQVSLCFPLWNTCHASKREKSSLGSKTLAREQVQRSTSQEGLSVCYVENAMTSLPRHYEMDL